MAPICIGCGKSPLELIEYLDMVKQEPDEYVDAVDYVKKEEGTYNRENGHFWCTSCYIKAGCPLGPAP